MNARFSGVRLPVGPPFATDSKNGGPSRPVGDAPMLQRKFSSALLTGMLAAGLLSPSPGALAGGTLRVAMTASDVPTTTGAPDNGYEGVRFFGYPVFEGLLLWDLSSGNKLPDLRPGLAESWEQSKEDLTKW